MAVVATNCNSYLSTEVQASSRRRWDLEVWPTADKQPGDAQRGIILLYSVAMKTTVAGVADTRGSLVTNKIGHEIE